jgi:hypothetical protein
VKKAGSVSIFGHGRTVWVVVACLLVPVSLDGCRDSSNEGEESAKDDFAGECQWPEQHEGSAIVECKDGEYAVRLQGAKTYLTIANRGHEFDTITVAADARREAGPFETTSTTRLTYGVACFGALGSPSKGYAFVISPDGLWAILVLDGSDVVPVAQGKSSEVGNEENRISGSCDAADRDSSQLAMSINGHSLGTAKDNRFRRFVGLGFYAYSTPGDAAIRFDNFEAHGSNP